MPKVSKATSGAKIVIGGHALLGGADSRVPFEGLGREWMVLPECGEAFVRGLLNLGATVVAKEGEARKVAGTDIDVLKRTARRLQPEAGAFG